MVQSYFENREAKLWYLNNKVKRTLSLGSPQGSASGPHYWNIQYNHLLELELDPSQEIEGFADDTILKIRAKTIDELEISANNVLKALLGSSK
jgi:hypothetical protein